MAKDPFLLVSLEESESKNLAQVMSNDTARKILDYLSKNESATETKIAKDLGIALSTAHYNLQALVKASLVQAEEFHYSEKGKEVLHYSLANKLIIIAPKKAKTENFMEKLKTLLPAAIVSLGVAGIIRLYTLFGSGATLASSKMEEISAMNYAPAVADGARMAGDELVQDAAPLAMKLAVDTAANASAEVTEILMTEAAPEAAMLAADSVPQAAPVVVQVVQSSPDLFALWFLAGSFVALLCVAIWAFIKDRKK